MMEGGFNVEVLVVVHGMHLDLLRCNFPTMHIKQNFTLKNETDVLLSLLENYPCPASNSESCILCIMDSRPKSL